MNVNNDLQGLQGLFPSPEVAEAQAAQGAQGAQGAREALGVAGQRAADEATLSPAASVAAQATPDSDVRMDKVGEVQQALAAGTYSVSSSAVADKMIDRMLGRG